MVVLKLHKEAFSSLVPSEMQGAGSCFWASQVGSFEASQGSIFESSSFGNAGGRELFWASQVGSFEASQISILESSFFGNAGGRELFLGFSSW